MELRKAARSALPFLLLLALGAALVEFIFLRLLLRGGGFAPPGETLDRIFGALMTAGLAGMNLATLAVGLSLALLAYLYLRGTSAERALSFLLLGVLGAGIILAFLSSPLLSILYLMFSSGVLVTLLVLHPQRGSWEFYAAFAIVVAVACTYYYQASVSLSALGLYVPAPDSVFAAGEMAAVAVPILLLPGRKWRVWLVPVALLSGLAVLVASQSALFPLITVWTVYFTFFLPAPLYALSASAMVYSLGDMLSQRPQRWAGIGLLMVAMAGRMFQDTYLAQLSLLGALLVVLPVYTLAINVPRSRSSSSHVAS